MAAYGRRSSARTPTDVPVPSRGPPGNSIVSSSQLSPRSGRLPSWYDDRRTHSKRGSDADSWDGPGMDRSDPRRRSSANFGGATSIAPSESISRVRSRPERGPRDYPPPAMSQYSQRSRRRSAPWQDLDYPPPTPSRRASSHGGSAWSDSRAAPLTEDNLETFNEAPPPPRSERGVRPEVRQDAPAESFDRKSNAWSRRDSGVGAREPPRSDARSFGAGTRRSSNRYSRVGYDDGPDSAQRSVASSRRHTQGFENMPYDEFNTTPGSRYERYDDGPDYGKRSVASTRRRTEVADDGPVEVVTPKSRPPMSRYRSYDRPTQSSQSKVTQKYQPRAASVYSKSADKRAPQSSTAGRNSQAKTTPNRRSRPPTARQESEGNGDFVKGAALAGAGAAAVAGYQEYNDRSPTQGHTYPNYLERENPGYNERYQTEAPAHSIYPEQANTGAGYHEQSRTQVRAYSISPTREEQPRQAEVRSQHYSQREGEPARQFEGFYTQQEVEQDRQPEVFYSQQEVEQERQPEVFYSQQDHEFEKQTTKPRSRAPSSTPRRSRAPSQPSRVAAAIETPRRSRAPSLPSQPMIASETPRQSRAPSKPTQAIAATGPIVPQGSNDQFLTSPESPDAPTAPTQPTSATSAGEPQWERRVHILETMKPDGRLVRDKEFTMRRLRPQPEVSA